MKYKINFDYRALEVAGLCLVNMFLIIITLGLYIPFAFLNIFQYITDNIEIMTSEEFFKIHPKLGKSTGKML